MKSRAVVMAALACLAVAFVAGCGPTKNKATGTQPTGTPASSAAAAPPVKDVPAGNCTLYTKADAVKLLGAVNFNNKNIEIKTDGGNKIDDCSYMNLQGTTALQAVSYAVVRYDSGTTAFTEATKVLTEMLADAGEHDWPVQNLTAPIPGAGQLLGGYGTKTDEGVTYTIAVVGTNVGPYLVVALGASTNGPDNAEKYALTAFQALTTAVR